ncbi:MAG TPA: PhzF family phenazine biosynthesis protein [Gemmatimonadales bacterium]|nr:PhzF family phenazine biosynthesis protein [Gemmatimonadales bacterium]
MDLRYHLLDVFTAVPFGGNQLAVFPDAPALEPALMQRIARELNLSETVFVLPPSSPSATHRMRIFTPGTELPFAGHPTLGTASLLASLQSGESANFILEQGAGPVPVRVTRTANGPWEAWMTAPRIPEVVGSPPSNDTLAAMLRVSPDDILTRDRGPTQLSAGVAFTFIPLRSAAVVSQAKLDSAQWQETLAGSIAPHVYCFAAEPERSPQAVRSRMFAPAMGIEEDPATGGAAAALAGYLARHHTGTEATVRWSISQGAEVGRPSELLLEVDRSGGRISAVRVGGTSVLIGEGRLRC